MGQKLNEKRFALVKELLMDPPHWFDKVLTFCRFDHGQLKELYKSGNKLQKNNTNLFQFLPTLERQKIHNVAYLQRAIHECDLLEPILQYIAETNDIDLVNLLHHQVVQHRFPWLFLAYLGSLHNNYNLVQICVQNLSGERGYKEMQREIGVAYMVWRFLLQGAGGEASAAQYASSDTLLRLYWPPKEGQDWTFLHLAAAKGDAVSLELLLKRVGDSSASILDARTELEGFTPLHVAAFYGHLACVDLLLRDNSTAYSSIPVDRVLGRSSLHYASSAGFPEVVKKLLDHWKERATDLQDPQGWTALHLALATRHFHVAKCLLGINSKHLKLAIKTAGQEFGMMSRFFLKRRSLISSTSHLLIPRPNILAATRWAVAGFTPLHMACAAHPLLTTPGSIPSRIENLHQAQVQDYNAVLKDLLESQVDCHDAQDSEGLIPSDYLPPWELQQTQECAGKTLPSELKWRKLFCLRVQVVEAYKVWVSQLFVYAVDTALLSGDYNSARRLAEASQSTETTSIDEYIAMRTGPRALMKVDEDAWDHLEWAFNEVLHGCGSNGRCLPQLHPSDAEDMVQHLVKNRTLCGKSTLQTCLQWAIDERMERLAEELVKQEECELLSVVPGCEDKMAPLAKASQPTVAHEMPRLLAAMELREDVKRRWYEDRQVYVDYASTLLVVAVLIAGLAFSGWLQPPRGYSGNDIDLTRQASRVFMWSNILSFILAAGTMVAAAVGCMPFGTGQLVSARDKVHNAVMAASLLLAASVAFMVVSFSSAAITVLPHHYTFTLTSFVAFCGILLGLMLLWFLKRLQDLQMYTKTSAAALSKRPSPAPRS